MVSEPTLHLTQKQARVVKPRVDQIECPSIQAPQTRRHWFRGYLWRIAHRIHHGKSPATLDIRYFIPLNFVCHLEPPRATKKRVINTFKCAVCLLTFPGHL